VKTRLYLTSLTTSVWKSQEDLQDLLEFPLAIKTAPTTLDECSMVYLPRVPSKLPSLAILLLAALGQNFLPVAAANGNPFPTGVTATAGNSKVRVNWTPAEKVSTYQVFRSTRSTDLGTPLGYGTDQFLDQTPVNGVTYFYRVASIRNGADKYSDPIAATPKSLAPYELSAASMGGAVHLSWKSKAPNQIFLIFRMGALIAKTSQSSFDDNGLPNGARYRYTVGVVDALLDTEQSNEVSGTFIDRYIITMSGPHHVFAGYGVFIQAKGQWATPIDERVLTTVTGLPSGASANFVNIEQFCCGVFLYSVDADNPIRIKTSASTPPGEYTITLRYETLTTHIIRYANWKLIVDSVPGPVSSRASTPSPSLASVPVWLNNMVYYGNKHCTSTEANSLWEGHAWYYDGERVYYQIADATGDPRFTDCALMFGNGYKSNLTAAGGVFPGWRIFPHGLATEYERTRSASSLEALNLLVSHQWVSNRAWAIPWGASREVAYNLNVLVQARRVSGILDPKAEELVDLILGHFDSWFLTADAPAAQPFMVALSSEALIGYWEYTHDPRIPWVLKNAADQLLARYWDGAHNCFPYLDANTGTIETDCTQGAKDLNLLIAPLFGWVYSQTKDPAYRDKGDALFTEGVFGAWLDGGKQFSQNYRWSAKYVEWRR
jgi:hypothetical protein